MNSSQNERSSRKKEESAAMISMEMVPTRKPATTITMAVISLEKICTVVDLSLIHI